MIKSGTRGRHGNRNLKTRTYKYYTKQRNQSQKYKLHFRILNKPESNESKTPKPQQQWVKDSGP